MELTYTLVTIENISRQNCFPYNLSLQEISYLEHSWRFTGIAADVAN
jgi:hypothetical protein